jgi:hypothetical protein
MVFGPTIVGTVNGNVDMSSAKGIGRVLSFLNRVGIFQPVGCMYNVKSSLRFIGSLESNFGQMNLRTQLKGIRELKHMVEDGQSLVVKMVRSLDLCLSYAICTLKRLEDVAKLADILFEGPKDDIAIAPTKSLAARPRLPLYLTN